MGLTEQAGHFVANTHSDAIPPEALDVARVGIADCVGVLIAGAGDAAPTIAARLVADDPRADAAPIIPFGRMTTAIDAALINGTAAHVLDYDDVALNAHPSTVLVPAILAQAYSLRSSGRQMLEAYVIGYEVWAWITALEPGALHDRGFHPPSAVGAMAAAAACARLQGLDAKRATAAIAISASLASGLVANFGTMTKSFHAGRAAQNGVLSARLADEGFTGSPDALEHKSGFLRSHSPTNDPILEQPDGELGRIWRLPQTGLHVKRYPICYATHRSIDGALDLIRDHNVRAADIAAIHVHTGAMQMLMLRNAQPQTGLEAKFSMPFAMACALIAGRVGLGELSDEFVTRADVQETMRLVTCSSTDERDPTWDVDYAPFDQVTYALKSGDVLTGKQVRRPRGSWQHPMSDAELGTKFVDCASRYFSPTEGHALFEQLWTLESVADARDLRLIAPGHSDRSGN